MRATLLLALLVASCAPVTQAPASRSAPAPRGTTYPTQVSPVNTSVGPQPTMTWIPVAGDDRYYLAVSDAKTQNVVGLEQSAEEWGCTAALCSYRVPAPLVDGEATWAVIGKAGPDYGPWSPTAHFTVVASATNLPPLPSILHITWDMIPAEEGAEAYRLQIDNGPVQAVPTTSSCDSEGTRVCRWDIALYDYQRHLLQVWAIRQSEEGPKAAIQVSLVDTVIDHEPPADPFNIRFSRE